MNKSRVLEGLLTLEPAVRISVLSRLSAKQAGKLPFKWDMWARTEQLPPKGDWRTWLICAGRGFGKTRSGAEWVRDTAKADRQARIALVAASLGEARGVMVEGESGVLACCAPDNQPEYEPSLRRLRWRNGAQAFLYSAGEPESLRGPQHSHARGAGAEGILRQRSPRSGRCSAAPGDRGRGRCAPRRTDRRGVLAGRRRADGRMDRASGAARLPADGNVAVR